MVAAGHITNLPAYVICSSAVSRYYVRIGFVIGDLNGLYILSADIVNAYINATCRDKGYLTAGTELCN